jgi:hypothetical protein
VPVGAWLSASILDLAGGGHIAFSLAGGANHAEEVPHLVSPGWQHIAAA